MKQEERRGDEAGGGRDGAGQTAAPQPVAPGKRRRQQMRKREPRAAQLIPSGSLIIDQAPGNVQMRLCVAEVEQPAMRREEPDGQQTQRDGGCGR